MSLTTTLRAALGDVHVVDGPEDMARLSRDILHVADTPASLAVAPGTVEELCAAVGLVYAAGRPIVARGAAWSYTRAHVPERAGTVIFDLRRLDRVSDLQVDDLHVTVESGCTWRDLRELLEPHGLSAPVWGPLSGRRATIGGTLAQDGVFFGSALYGTVGDTVLGLEVVRSDGTILGTGAQARDDAPFTRIFGPNLTGMFVGDAGAFGIKARVTLALVPAPVVTGCLSFAVGGMRQAVSVLSDLARLGLASELVAFDGHHHSLLESVPADTAASVHAVVDAADAGQLTAALSALRQIGQRHGQEIPATVPTAIRGDPFGATQMIFNSVRDELLPPLNAILPPSRVEAAVELLEGVRPAAARLGLELWMFATVVGRSLVVIEPSLRVMPGHDTRAAAVALREEIAALLDPLGAGHLQLGKFYAYASRLRSPSLDTILSLKRTLDPSDLFNPGALGLLQP